MQSRSRWDEARRDGEEELATVTVLVVGLNPDWFGCDYGLGVEGQAGRILSESKEEHGTNSLQGKRGDQKASQVPRQNRLLGSTFSYMMSLATYFGIEYLIV